MSKSNLGIREVLKRTAIPSLIGALITLLGWVGLFSWSLAAMIYDDHEYLVSSVIEAKASQQSVGGSTLEDLRAQIAQLKNRQPPITPQCWMQNVSIPPPRNLPAVASASQAIFFCNTERKAPLFIVVSYDSPPDSVGPILFPANRQVSMMEALQNSQIGVKVESPSILPYQISLVTAYGSGEKPPIATKIQVTPINPEH